MLGSLQCPSSFAFELAPALDLRLKHREHFSLMLVASLPRAPCSRKLADSSLPCSCVAADALPGDDSLSAYFLSTVRRDGASLLAGASSNS
jgi:hypothetical protein